MVQQAQKTPVHYEGREQSLVKHKVLEEYLLEFGLKVGSEWSSITYVDGFSGPWNVKSEKLEDASFSIALSKLRIARGKLAQRGINIELRCFFVEADATAFAKLKQFKDSVDDAEIEVRNCTFEEAIPEIIAFVKAGGKKTFPFVFIDPTGWTGFSMPVIKPLLELRPVEVLVNFMTRFIKRFADAPEAERHEEFQRLFGTDEYRKLAQVPDHLDREDALVRLYMQKLHDTGDFDYVCAALVLHPELEATHFHLIYATRHPAGVRVFKTAEKKAMQVQEDVRAEAQQRQRLKKSAQAEIFAPKELAKVAYFSKMRDRYCTAARAQVLGILKERGSILFDLAWQVATRRPLVWESDLKLWVKEWEDAGVVAVKGLDPKAHVPQCGKGHWLVHIAKA